MPLFLVTAELPKGNQNFIDKLIAHESRKEQQRTFFTKNYMYSICESENRSSVIESYIERKQLITSVEEISPQKKEIIPSAEAERAKKVLERNFFKF